MKTGRLQLLIVDDDEGHIEAIRRAFDEAGGEVDIHAAGTLQEYRERAAAEPPDIAVVDLNLPDGRAVEVLSHPPEDAPFPVLVMTAFGTQQIVVEVMKAGALDYVVKSPEVFVAMPHTVERVLREWKQLQDQKKAESELREKEYMLLESQRLGHIGTWFYKMTGQISWSDELYRLYGVSPATFSLTPKSFLRLIHPADRPVMRAWITACAEGKKPDALEYRIILPDGTIRFLYGTGQLVAGVGSTYMAGTVQDITERKRAEAERVEMQAQLLQSQKMEAVGVLAGGVAHDFNNILTAIRAYAGYIYKDLRPEDPMRSDAEEILAASDRAAALTRQLLAFSRKQILTPQVVDLNKIVGDMTKMLKRLLREDIQLVTKLTSMPCAVLVDPGQLEQVILNLVVNARDAMPKGGTLNLETDIADGPGISAASPDLARGPVVCLRVRDNGSGMSDEVKRHVFEPFYTTKEMGKGTGLGLSTVFGIVKQSNGQVSVESEPGKGATFSVYLPLLKAAVPDIGISEPQAIAGKNTETVLLVEDDEMLRRLGERLLKESGYTVLTAFNGKNALETMERYGKPVDLLLSDVVMPGMSGRDLARELERRKLIRRTLYMSGYTDDAMVKHRVLEPNIVFIYKPFSAEALAAKLREVLDGPADKAKA